MPTSRIGRLAAPAALVAGLLALSAATPGATTPQPPPPAVSGMHYELTFDAAAAAARSLGVVTRFQVDAAGPVELSLPAWTPGAYEVSNFARKVAAFAASQGGREIAWDKADPDTWRVRVPAAGAVEVRFTYSADSLDNAMAWARADFLLVNGTNVFLYPEGAGFDFGATVTVRTEADWRVAKVVEILEKAPAPQ
jgi:predicted metalloprotease with PDZ domain